MRRLLIAALAVGSLMPTAGCQYICTDSRAEAYGRNWIPFSRRYRMCNKNHCVDRNGDHIDQRCSCSKKCTCWGPGSTAMLPGEFVTDEYVPADPDAGGCGCSDGADS